MNEITITFTPSGTGRTLYSEAIDLTVIGPLDIRRASTIEFDNPSQHWFVRDTTGVPVYRNPSRQQCLEWERRYLEQREDHEHELQHGTGPVATGPRSGIPQDHVTR